MSVFEKIQKKNKSTFFQFLNIIWPHASLKVKLINENNNRNYFEGQIGENLCELKNK